MEEAILECLGRISLRLSEIDERLSGRDDEILVSCTEAARLLGKTPPTISMMIRDGRLHKTSIDGSTGIRLSEVWKMKTP